MSEVNILISRIANIKKQILEELKIKHPELPTQTQLEQANNINDKYSFVLWENYSDSYKNFKKNQTYVINKLTVQIEDISEGATVLKAINNKLTDSDIYNIMIKSYESGVTKDDNWAQRQAKTISAIATFLYDYIPLKKKLGITTEIYNLAKNEWGVTNILVLNVL